MTSLLTKIRDLANALVHGPRPVQTPKPRPNARPGEAQQQEPAGRPGETGQDLEEARVADLLKQDQSSE